MKRRSVLLGALLISSATWVAAQTAWPARPITLIVPYPPGGGIDITSRDIAKGLSALWGQPVVVENKPGAGETIAANATVKAAPDGYTLLIASDAITVAPFMQSKLPYDTLADLQPITLIGSLPMMLVTTPSFKVKTLAEFVAAAKAKPGMIDYASNGVGGAHHITMERFQRIAGVKLNHIPYKGGAPALLDVIGGRVPVMWVAVATALSQVRSGTLVPVAVGSLERLPLLPQVPTFSESGFPGFEAVAWMGVMGPAKMPGSLVQKIQTDLQKITQNADYHNRQTANGNEVRASTSDEFVKRFLADYNRNKEMSARGEIPRE